MYVFELDGGCVFIGEWKWIYEKKWEVIIISTSRIRYDVAGIKNDAGIANINHQICAHPTIRFPYARHLQAPPLICQSSRV